MDWIRGQTIGRGSTATVSIANFKNFDHPFAVKSSELRQSELLQKEQKLLSNLNFPQIVAYKGHEVTEENGKLFYNIFMEYAAGGTLIDAIRRRGGEGFDESTIRSYTRDILLGLERLHCNGIVHCDIKSQNILVTENGAKIADFGCAKRVFDEMSERNLVAGTPIYMAPEAARGEIQGFACDIWSLGCTIVEMTTGKNPWKNVFPDPVSAIYQIGFSENVPEIPSFLSKQGKDFVAKCLIRDPNERWSASELINHAFITEEKCPKICNLETPTSVLEERIWDSSEDLGVKFAHKNCSFSSSESPLQRVLQLAQCISHESNWEEDDSWVTVRAVDSPKFVPLNQGNGKNLGVLVSGEFNSINYVSNHSLITTIGGIGTLNTTSISGGCKDTVTLLKVLLVLCVSVENCLFISCKFEKEIIIKDSIFNIEVLAYFLLLIIVGYLNRLIFKLKTFVFPFSCYRNLPIELYPMCILGYLVVAILGVWATKPAGVVDSLIRLGFDSHEWAQKNTILLLFESDNSVMICMNSKRSNIIRFKSY